MKSVSAHNEREQTALIIVDGAPSADRVEVSYYQDSKEPQTFHMPREMWETALKRYHVAREAEKAQGNGKARPSKP